MNEKQTISINKMSDLLQNKMQDYIKNLDGKLCKDADEFFVMIESVTITFFMRNLYKILVASHLPEELIEDYLEDIFKKSKKTIMEELEKDKEINH